MQYLIFNINIRTYVLYRYKNRLNKDFTNFFVIYFLIYLLISTGYRKIEICTEKRSVYRSLINMFPHTNIILQSILQSFQSHRVNNERIGIEVKRNFAAQYLVIEFAKKYLIF